MGIFPPILHNGQLIPPKVILGTHLESQSKNGSEVSHLLVFPRTLELGSTPPSRAISTLD